MSTGHRHAGLDDDPISEAEYTRILAAHPQLAAFIDGEHSCSHAYDMPYGAGYNVSGSRFYIDRFVPLIWNIKKRRSKTRAKTNIAPLVLDHEKPEKGYLLFVEKDYRPAHAFAIRCEMLAVQAKGFDWDDYEQQWEPLIRADEMRAGKVKNLRLPDDFDLTPFLDEETSFDKEIIPKLRAAMKDGKRLGLKAKVEKKLTKESVNYRSAENPGRRCGTCSMFRRLTETHRAGSCTLVAGEIFAPDTCDEWEAKA